MTKKITILVAGIGGVGGYFGGLLARKYHAHDQVEIVFLARGKHLQKIQESGLRIEEDTHTFTVHPARATDDTQAIGIADYILICTKGYDLEATIEQLKPCIGAYTVLLPLLNGVDAADKIARLLPDACIADGCVYIVARLREAGVIEHKGNIQLLYFGLEGKTDPRLSKLEKLMLEAGIEATLSNTITSIIWEKFIFISPTATATSYFNCAIGELMQQHENTVQVLIGEVIGIAKAKGVSISTDIKTRTLNRLHSLPPENTSSMHNDYRAGKPFTEVNSLTGYVVATGEQLQIAVPTYTRLYSELLQRI